MDASQPDAGSKRPASLPDLPFEVISHIFAGCGLATLSSLLLVSRRIKDAAAEEFWRQWALSRLDALRVRRLVDFLESAEAARARGDPLPGILAPPRPIRSLRLTGPFDSASTRNLARLFRRRAAGVRSLDLADARGLDTLPWGPTRDFALEKMVAACGSGGLRSLVMPRSWGWRYEESVYTDLSEYARLVKTAGRKPALYDWVDERLVPVLAGREGAPWLAQLRELAFALDVWSIDDPSRMLEAWERAGVSGDRLRKLTVWTRHFVPDIFLSEEVGFYDPIPAAAGAPATGDSAFPNIAPQPFAEPSTTGAPVVALQPPAPRPIRRYPLLANLTALTISCAASRDGFKDGVISSSFLLEILVSESRSLKHLAIHDVEYLPTRDIVLPPAIEHVDLRGCGLTVSQWKTLLTPPPGDPPYAIRSLVIDATTLHVPYPRAAEDDLDDPSPSPAPFLAVLSRLSDLTLHLPPLRFGGVFEDPVHRFPRKLLAHLDPSVTRVHLDLHPSLEPHDPRLLSAHVQLLAPLFPTPTSALLVRSAAVHAPAPVRPAHVDLLADCHARFPRCGEFAAVPAGAPETWGGDAALAQLVRERGVGDARREGGGMYGGGGLVFTRAELETLMLGSV